MELFAGANLEIIAGVLVFVSIAVISASFMIRQNDLRKWNDALINRDTLWNRKQENNLVKVLQEILFGKEGTREEITNSLLKAGYENISPETVYILSMIMGAFLSIFAFGVFYTQSMFLTVVAVAVSALFGYRILFILLKARAESFQKEKQAGVLVYAEALQVACEAGLSLILAIERISEYYPSSLSMEFKQAYEEFMQNMKTKKEALQDIIDRVGGEEIKILVDSIIQAEDTGASVRNILQSVAESIRNTARKNIMEKGEKAKWKNFAVSWIFQFIPYLYIIIGPAIISLGTALQ